MNKWIEERIKERIKERMNESMNGWKDGGMIVWMNGKTEKRKIMRFTRKWKKNKWKNREKKDAVN